MRGLSLRKGSKVYQGRFYIPTDLWNRREDLRRLGIDVQGTQEVHLSLGEKDQEAASKVYAARLDLHDLKMKGWRERLGNDPLTLNHRQCAAIAGQAALEFVRRHENNPEGLPAPMEFIRYGLGWLKELMTEEKRFFVYMGDPIAELIEEVKYIPFVRLPAFISKQRSEGVGPERAQLLDYLEFGYRLAVSMQGRKLALAEAAKLNRSVSKPSADLLHSAGKLYAGLAVHTLSRRADFDFSEPDWKSGIPPLETQAKPPALPTPAKLSSSPDLFRLLDHKASTKSIRPKTVSQYRESLQSFVKLIGHSDPFKVTQANVRDWRDAMIAKDLAPRTINGKHLAALSSVLAHACREFDLPKNVALGIRDNRTSAATDAAKGYTREEVETILRATFKGSKKEGLSVPHKRAIFWLPWLMAYTGLRAGEVAQLQGRNVRADADSPHIVITPEDGSTKSGQVWKTGIHRHLIELGFLDFARSIGDGPLFYEPYPKGTALGSIKNPRWVQAYKRVAEWIRDEVKITAPLGRANHAFRHAMTTASRGGGTGEDAWERLDKMARDYMLGSGSKGDAREQYGDWSPEVLCREINKLPAFEVADTGRRPY